LQSSLQGSSPRDSHRSSLGSSRRDSRRSSQNSSPDSQKKKLLLGGGIILAFAVVLVAVAVFILRPPAPEEPAPPPPPPPEESLVVEDVPLLQEPEPPPLVFPLTGVPTDDKAATLRRTLSVKIENTPMARPQTGLPRADVVYETVTEGGITRFNCLFQSDIPEEVGPVRSARLSDLSIVPQYDAIFFFSGANSYVRGEITSAALSDMSHTKASSLYYRVDYREAPHNLYLRLANSITRADEKGFATTLDTPRSLEFSFSGEKDGVDGEPESAPAAQWAALPDATYISVGFSTSYVAEWAWDTATQTYLRSMDGATIDAATGEQIAATNVIVLWTSYVDAPDDKTLFLDLNGKGQATLFIGGKRVEGTWESNGATPPRFKDANGDPILLSPGKTWFQVLDPTWPLTSTP
jgi:hypothetical protein